MRSFCRIRCNSDNGSRAGGPASDLSDSRWNCNGPDLNRCKLNIGTAWQTIFADGAEELDIRYAIETHDGSTIEIVDYGLGMVRQTFWRRSLKAKRYRPVPATCVRMRDWKLAMRVMTGLIEPG